MNLSLRFATTCLILFSICTVAFGEQKPKQSDKVLFEPVVLYFAFDSSELDDASQVQLDSIAAYLNRYSDMSIQVLGYADQVGDEQYNLNLSELRAKQSSSYLVKKGVKAERMEVVAKGEVEETQDGKPNDKEARRVELRLLMFVK